MREPSVSGIRGLNARGCLFALLVLALFGADTAFAQTISLYKRDTGRINFVTTGGSLRNAPNVTNACTINTTSTQSLSGIPATRTVRSAYLYWGASGDTADTSVTLNGTAVTASRTFARTFNNGTDFNFFGAFADVTSLVTGNGSFTFGGLTVNTGGPWCGSQAVVGGWSLVVVYEGAAERLRAINIYDGLDYFYGSQVTQTPSGFRVPSTNIDGRVAVFTLEGDPQNSTASGGFGEALRFNGTLLDDGLVPANSDPTVQQFDGTISTQGSVTSYGVDVDQYDVSAMLSPGQTSATTVYSAGADLVLLMAQVVSATSDPAVDLAITKTHSGTFISGGTGQYTITVSNGSGPNIEREDNTVTVTDTLPAGLTFNSASGTGWTCGAVAQVVTCTHPPILNEGTSFPPITLTVNVLEAAAASVTNSATVTTPSYDSDTANNTVTDVTATIDPNLSTSTKSVVDLNGGEASPGDTLRYTVTLTESGGGQAINVTMTDSVPVNTTFGGFVSIPAGAASAFAAAPAGDNLLGLLTVSGITVPANGSVTVVFDVTVASVSPGAQIDNEATVNNPNGPDATPAAPQVIVNPSLLPGSGTKQLYLWSAPLQLSRTRPTGTHAVQTINGNNQSLSFTITPALQKALTLNPGTFAVNLLLARTGTTSTTSSRTVTVTLSNSALGTIGSDSLNFTSGAVTMRTFTLNTGGVTAPVGSTFTLVVNNNSGNTGNRSVSLTPYAGANYSRVDLNSATVINVDSVQTFSAAFNGGVAQTTFYPGANVFVRATVSDPFGSFDISSTTISVIDPTGTTVVTSAPMIAQGAPATCNSTSAATCVYQYQYAVPASPIPPLGVYTVRVTGNEGAEGTITDLGVGTFTVAIPQPSITLVKSSTVLSDPTGSATPKRIPLAVVQYDISVTNSGPGTVDANTLVITDPLPTGTTMYVSTTPANPVVFVNGTTASGLTFVYASNVAYSNVGASGPWTYAPVPDVNGFDANVKAVRVSPGGIMSAAGTGNPSFTIQFRVRIN
ncbi:MAG: DUF11 domain-containing protein [Pseudomonadota bacterium]